jgi:D-glycero-D-manno-heptose 1,7-bisphosphate phosphatase
MRLVLLDRDGVLNVDRPDWVKSPGELVMLPGAALAVARLNRAGLLVAVCSNQAVVGRGVIDVAVLARIHEKLTAELARAGARLDALTCCTDPPGSGSRMRKPAPGMLLDAMRRFRARGDETAMIGDSLKDLEAAAAAGCRRILVRSGQGRKTQAAGLPPHVLPVAVREDLPDAVTALLGDSAGKSAAQAPA